MKHWAMFGLLALAMSVAAGCSKNKDVNQPESYDPSVSAPPTAVFVMPNATLLDDQTAVAKAEVARQTAAANAAAAGAAGGAAPKTPAPAAPAPKPATSNPANMGK